MKIFISNLNINDSRPDNQLIQVQVSFYDEVNYPHLRADVSVFLRKDKTKTIGNIKKEAIGKAVMYLKSVLAGRSQ